MPRYVIEGDAERGIEPMAPDLKAVKDLLGYSDLFVDEEDPSRGRIYGAIPGWEANDVLYKKYLLYGLDSEYNYFQSGSDASLAGVISSAYEKGQPIVAYYWDPTWLLGKYDMVLLEDEPYVNVEDFKAGKTAFPSVKVTITASNNFNNNPENADFCEFLSNFHSSSALTNEALAYMQDNPGVSYTDTARWFLGQHPELLDEWLPEDLSLIHISEPTRPY